MIWVYLHWTSLTLCSRDEKVITDWYEKECTNGTRLGLEGESAYQFNSVRAGTPLAFLGAEDGCVVPERVMAAFRSKLEDLPKVSKAEHSSKLEDYWCKKSRRVI